MLRSHCLMLPNHCLILRNRCLMLRSHCLMLPNHRLILRNRCLIPRNRCLILRDHCLMLRNHCLMLRNRCLMLLVFQMPVTLQATGILIDSYPPSLPPHNQPIRLVRIDLGCTLHHHIVATSRQWTCDDFVCCARVNTGRF